MEDLFGIIIFVIIALLSMMGKKKPKAQPPARVRRPPMRTPSPATRPERAEPVEAPARPEGFGALLEMLQGQLEQRAPEYTEVPEAISLEPVESRDARPLDAASHEAFHEQYVVEPALETQAPAARHRYRLTPTTAREAVVWTAIFSKPKGLE